MTETNSDGAVVISNKDIYDKLVDVEKTVAGMAPLGQTSVDHETRLRLVEQLLPNNLQTRLLSLEKWKYSIPASIATAIIAIVEQLVNRHG